MSESVAPSGTNSGKGYVIPSHGGGKLRPFPKGVSGNPNGISGEYKRAVQLARQNSVAAVEQLIVLMTSDDARVSAVACEAIWNKAWGKRDPATIDERQVEKRLDLSKLTQAELRFLLQLIRSGAVITGEREAEVASAAPAAGDTVIEGEATQV